MGFHAYCITPAEHQPTGSGVQEQPVRAVRSGALAAWASEHAARPTASIEAIRLHDGVVRRAMTAQVTPVPLRFGQWSESAEALQDRLGRQADHWRELLDQLAGTVEMGVRIASGQELAPALPEASPLAPPASGREYLQRAAHRVHERARDRTIREQVLAAVARHVDAHVARTASGDVPERGELLWLAHLVRRDRLEAYRAALAEAARELPECRFRVTGPWPPYSFVA